ncbi:MAG: BrnT family toxin, partial [Muribaculaceae bacterium]|nr:BrnT family toxin [Muribaculaceae bacterium]
RVFKDFYRIEKFDERHSANEDRYITIGEIDGKAVIVMVVYTDRVNAVRIISARKATRFEKEEYYDNKKNY